MDLSFSPEEIAFRAEVRAWLAEAMPPKLRQKAEVDAHFEHAEVMEWHKVLAKKGWVAPHWPKEHGGPGLDATKRFILTEELRAPAGTPHLSPFGLVMLGPLLMQFGTDAQKKRFLPKILSGEEVWCQGYSEPNAGSDLASLKLRAEDDGQGHFILNGQKTWTTYAQYADWIFCLVRTDPKAKKQQGISFVLAPMKSEGLVVKPMLTTGGTDAFCETFFENVKIPKENLVGELNNGWTVAKSLLGHERTLIAAVGVSRRVIHRVKRIAAATSRERRRDAPRRSDLARADRPPRGPASRPPDGELPRPRERPASATHARPRSRRILKIRGSEINQQAFELAMDVMGHDALSWFNEAGVVPPLEQWVAPSFNYTRATTIYGGSNEIQKNIIAKMILGLPS